MSSIFVFLTVVQAIVAALLVAVILMQKSEGGGLGVGGSPTGLMSARGAADLLTRATAILATAFVVLSIVLAALAVRTTNGRSIDDTLNRTAAPADSPVAPAPADPLGGAALPAAGGQAPAAPAPAGVADPLGGATKKP
jgi:preprotein translocase subunit SecG